MLLKIKATLVITSMLFTVALSGCGSESESICGSIRSISRDLATSLQALASDFSSEQNDKLAKSLAELRNLSTDGSAVNQSKILLEKSIEKLMSNLIAGDTYAAAENVNDMTVAIQTLTAACLIK